MIIVKIMGGLGNQMFQYAFGRAVATRLSRELVFDLTSMPTGRGPHRRRWELPQLAIRSTRQIGARGLQVQPDPKGQILRRVTREGFRALGWWRVDEPADDHLIDVDAIPKRIAHCVGYWQSHHYFSSISDAIRFELQPKKQLWPAVANFRRQVGDRTTVAVHVRRGDYVSDARVAKVHGTLDGAYYRGAVASIAANVEKPLAVVFSDDPMWAVDNLQLGVETIHVEQKQRLTAVETLGAMSACSHHVIANSSLSWWCAYLAQHPDQQVIYPHRWFIDRTVEPNFRFPSHWTPHASA